MFGRNGVRGLDGGRGRVSGWGRKVNLYGGLSEGF